MAEQTPAGRSWSHQPDYFVGSPEGYRSRTLHCDPAEMEAFLLSLGEDEPDDVGYMGPVDGLDEVQQAEDEASADAREGQ